MLDWLMRYRAAASRTDRLTKESKYRALLASGLFGEVGSLITEMKKQLRERNAYAASPEWILEEYGDILWYLVRLSDSFAPDILESFVDLEAETYGGGDYLSELLLLGAESGDLLRAVHSGHHAEIRSLIVRIWERLVGLARLCMLTLEEAADHNLKKIESRWPEDRVYHPLFDDDFSEDQQLPRKLEIDFVDRSENGRRIVVLRCNGINFGDRLSDNIQDPDDYRFHDIFHFAYAVHLGWSPVIRALMRCKRKSDSRVDEAQDGARAGILEEAVAATVFSRASKLNYFDGVDHVDYDLLKTIKGFVKGFEVDQVPLWQWEVAILEGFRIFRLLRANPGGRVEIDMKARKLRYFDKV